jgi:pimeloyl-ACP methyl ester carboxylesterase
VITLLLAGLGLTAVTVIGHGLGAMTAARRAARIWNERKDRLGRLGAELLVVRLVSALLLTHVVEAGIWALFFALVGAVPDPETAAYFSLTSYSTLGYGDIVLPEPWRLLGPIEAVVGVLMLGWSTGILVAMIGRIHGAMFQVVVSREPPGG